MQTSEKSITAFLICTVLFAAGCDSGPRTAGARHSSPGNSTTEETLTRPFEIVSKSTQLLDKTFDDIKFDIEPDAPFYREMLTPEIEALDGKRVRIRGYILPTPQKKGLKSFVLVRDNMECCFGPGAALYDCILIEMQPGNTAEFVPHPVAVTGEFKIKELKMHDGSHLAIYRMKGEEVN